MTWPIKLSGYACSSCACLALFANNSVEQRLSKLEKEMQEVCVQNDAGTIGATFAPYFDNPPYQWFFDAEVLLWHAKAGGVDWAILYDESIYPSNGSMYTLGFGWDWGVRVGLGKCFMHDAWDVGLFYTYFRTDDSSKVNIAFQSSEGPFGTANGSFTAKLNYNALDLGLGRSFFLSKDLMMHPHIGLKNIWLNQIYKLYSNNYINALSSSLGVSGTMNKFVKDTNTVWGIGPQVGLDGGWNFCNGFKLISSVDGALLQSYLRVVQKQNLFIAPDGSTPLDTTMKLSGPLHQFVPYARLQLGLGWGGDINQQQQHLDLSLSYEANYFWRVNQTYNDEATDPSAPSFASTESVRVILNRVSEDICFYGVTGRVTIAF